MARQFNVDASALLDEQAQQIASLHRENLILRHQLKDAEAQLDRLEGVEDKKAPAEDVVHDITTVSKTA